MWKLDKAVIPLTALFVMGLATVAASDVTVIRGAAVQIIATGQETPTVLRGGGSVILPVSSPAARTGRAGAAQIAAGRTLWLVDESRRRITACYLRGTATIDRRRIICTRY